MQTFHVVALISLLVLILFFMYRRGMLKMLRWPFGGGSSSSDRSDRDLKNTYKWA